MEFRNKTLISDGMKIPAIFALALLGFLLMLSGVFYHLRMAFLDGPFMIFQIIKLDRPDIMVQRYGSIVTQVWPYMAQSIGLPLSLIMFIYSVSFNLFYFVTGVFLYKMKQYSWLLILGFYQICFSTDSFFWPNNEIHQGMAWLAITAGFWFYLQQKALKYKGFYWVALLSLAITVFTHPLMIPVVVFLYIFLLLHGKFRLNDRSHLSIGFFILLICVLKLYVSSHNWYDGNKFNQLAEQSAFSLEQILSGPVMKAFFKDLFARHFITILVFCVSCYALISRRKYLQLLFMAGYTICYLLLVAIAFKEFNRFYIESQWMPVSVFIIAPLIFNFDLFTHKRKTVIFSSLVIAGWLMNMPDSVSLFQKRFTFQEHVIGKMKERNVSKLILTDVPRDVKETVMLSWALPVESLLISSANEVDQPRTFIFDQKERAGKGPNIFLSSFEEIEISKMNRQYFRLNESEEYTVLSYADFFGE